MTSYRTPPDVNGLPASEEEVLAFWQEHGVFDKRTRRFAIDAIPNKMPDRLTIKGVFYTQPIDERSSRRLFDGTVKAKLFGVGTLLEGRLIADMEANYEGSAKFTNRYIAEKGL